MSRLNKGYYDIYEEGWRAARDGTSSTNPYPKGAAYAEFGNAEAWEEGYSDSLKQFEVSPNYDWIDETHNPDDEEL